MAEQQHSPPRRANSIGNSIMGLMRRGSNKSLDEVPLPQKPIHEMSNEELAAACSKAMLEKLVSRSTGT